jgi:hypothetical protein
MICNMLSSNGEVVSPVDLVTRVCNQVTRRVKVYELYINKQETFPSPLLPFNLKL